MLSYKGYHARVEYRPDRPVLFGRVLGVRDTVAFEAGTASSVQTAFEGAVGDYLAFCGEIWRDPDRPFSVRLTPDLHRAAALAAEAEDESLNHFVRTAVAHEVERRGVAPA